MKALLFFVRQGKFICMARVRPKAILKCFIGAYIGIENITITFKIHFKTSRKTSRNTTLKQVKISWV